MSFKPSSKKRALRAIATLEGKLSEGMPSTQSLSFRDFLESPDFCNVTPSPLIAAIADAADGKSPSTIDDDLARKHFGCSLDGLPQEARKTIDVRLGGRAGKSTRLLAPKALHAAWTVPLPTVIAGEWAVSLIIAPRVELARHTLSFVIGYVESSRILRRALYSDPTRDKVELRRPDGKLVRLQIAPASVKGVGGRGRTCVFAGLEEAAFFYDEITGAINDAEVYSAVLQRVVPEGQVWIVSTPWLAKTGLLEKHIDEDWGRHTHHLCVIGGTRAFNPTWDPDGVIEREMRETDPDKARREIDGEPLEGTASSFFDWSSIEKAIDDTCLMPRKVKPNEEVTAGGDFGFRSDSSAMCVVHRDSESYRIADLLELKPQPGNPLKPSEVVRAFGQRLKTEHNAGLEYLVADSHYRETIAEHLAEFGLGFKEAPLDVATTYIRARSLFRENKIRLPRNQRLLEQLRAIKWRPNPGGSISIVLPRDKSIGGHCDLVAALILAVWESSGLPCPEPVAELGSPAYYRALENKIVAGLERDLEERKEDSGNWWAKPVSGGGVL